MSTTAKAITPQDVPYFEEGNIPVMEHFYTLQGEGAYSGQAAYFIRLAGCDVGCVWCDVKASWQIDENQIMSIQKLVEAAEANPARMAVITGGEPLLHDLSPLTNQLKAKGFQIHIETSGAHPLSGHIDWICLSPKKFKQPVDSIYEKAHELKVVIYNKKDFEWAEQEGTKVNRDCRLFLQPEWGQRDKVMPWIVEYVKNDPKWEISLQTHNYLAIP